MKKHDPKKQVRILNTRANVAMNAFLSAIKFDHSVASQRIHAESFLKTMCELDACVAQNASPAERLEIAERVASRLESNPRLQLLNGDFPFLAKWRAAGSAAERARLADEIVRTIVAEAPKLQVAVSSKSAEDVLQHAKMMIALAFPDIEIPKGPLVPRLV